MNDKEQALERPEVPEGWQLVPKEPTHAMFTAFHNGHSVEGGTFDSGYAAMLAAATPPAAAPAEAPAVAEPVAWHLLGKSDVFRSVTVLWQKERPSGYDDASKWMLEPLYTAPPDARLGALEDMLREAAQLFRFYEQSHRAKGPGHEEKVRRNADIATRIEALTAQGGEHGR